MNMNEISTFPRVNVGEYVSFKTGKLNSNAAKLNGKYPFFTCSQETYLTDTYSFDTECVLLGGNNANGIYPIFYFTGKFDAYQRTYVIQSLDKTKLVNRYLFYALQLQLEILRSISTGAATKFLTLTILNTIEIPFPPLPTQQKVAAILSAYDDLIENNTRRIKILEEMAQAIYREWFVNFRFPGHEGVRMGESELGPVPDGWDVVPFTDIADILSGGTPKTTESLYWGGNIPFFAPKDASGNFYIISTDSHITELGLKKCNSRLFPKDTVIITARGTVGKVIMPAIDMAMNQSCYALVGKDSHSQIFLFLLTRESTDYFKKNTGGATFETIVIDTFRKFKVIKPSKEIIRLFSEMEKPIFDMIENLLWKNANLHLTRDLLLPKLISGEIDVSELDIRIPEAEA